MAENKGASKEAIQFHYDVGNDFYASFLDPTMTYTAALWPDGDVTSTSLEAAQRAKLNWHLAGLNLRAGDRLLDIGCGWGSMMQTSVSTHQLSEAVGLTLSDAQVRHVTEAFAGTPISALNCPWQNYTAEQPFNAVVSLGALEHFAAPQMTRAEKIACYSDFFGFCANTLAENGRLSLQTITWMNIRPEQELAALPQHIFPESNLPHQDELAAAAHPWFHLSEMHNRPADYAETLGRWGEALRADRARLSELHGAETVRRYISAFAVFKLGFEHGIVGLSRYRFIKRSPRNALDGGVSRSQIG